MIGKARNALTLVALLAVGAQPAAAQGTGSLISKIELEKSTPSSDGEPPKKAYVAPDVVVPGDRVRVAHTFANNGAAPAAGLNLVNPILDGLTFDDTADTAGFGVSTDGGKTFGPLAAPTVPVDGAALRPATAADVTHVRWLWPDAIAPGQSRSVAFFGRVR
ncbi:hypothetical protein ASE06_07635 [Sphingopyxis sp. Root214]|uniref:hypothetical protein n=1 Tax=unclassified Sphingopyxis TaxID=2614943 RepID=UPI0006F9D586|nr:MULTISPECIES: hypothetical protein [unclassified Sphingopyxis]KQZ76423.1 hypothetical protein ASD73_00360 [Sphingopyxis sp. Root154]KRC09689.1 hypothetical protein ASE06_07635 [Sphingopyxis sp. Root214]